MTIQDWYNHRYDADRATVEFFQRFDCSRATPSVLDALLADGWRHHGCTFFRDMYGLVDNHLQLVIPLRIRVAAFQPSKQQRRVLRRSADLHHRFGPATLDDARQHLFSLHRQRFTENRPERIEDFLGASPATIPTRLMECAVYAGDRLLACSFFDLGMHALSSVYAVFDPEAARRSPGILTLLHELDFARRQRKQFLYLGYAHAVASHYDYKKHFAATEFYDWRGGWHPLAELEQFRPAPHFIENLDISRHLGQHSS